MTQKEMLDCIATAKRLKEQGRLTFAPVRVQEKRKYATGAQRAKYGTQTREQALEVQRLCQRRLREEEARNETRR